MYVCTSVGWMNWLGITYISVLARVKILMYAKKDQTLVEICIAAFYFGLDVDLYRSTQKCL